MPLPSLAEAVARQPYPDFQEWWPLGEKFAELMAQAIGQEWRALAPAPDDFDPVQAPLETYTRLVYARPARPNLAADFARQRGLGSLQSGEFDGLSYAFYRTAFAALAHRHPADELAPARRRFTERVGARFFAQLARHLRLHLPPGLETPADFGRLQSAIRQVGDFLTAQGYLRTHFAFRFDVSASHRGQAIRQQPGDVLPRLAAGETAYALYEMGYPVILPSAVYLYQTVGEAQHHSSRTIEELFARVGCAAWETDDFDPSGFPSELVVELWEIKR